MGNFEVSGRRRIDILASLRLYHKFISDARHGEDKSWRLRVGLYLAPQPRDEHVDVAIIGPRTTPNNRTTELVTRQHPTRTTYECDEQRDLGAGQLHFQAISIHKGMSS